MAAGSHHGCVRNLRLKVSVSFLKRAHPETVLVLLLDTGLRHVDKAVTRVVVGVDQVLDDIHSTHGAAVRQICPYPCFDGLMESFHHGRLLFALTVKVLDTVAFHQRLEVRVEEFLDLVGHSRLGWRGFAVVSICPKAGVIALASLEWTGTALANLENI